MKLVKALWFLSVALLYASAIGFLLVEPEGVWWTLTLISIVTVLVVFISYVSKKAFGETTGKYWSNLFWTSGLVALFTVIPNFYGRVYERLNPTYKEFYVNPNTNEVDSVNRKVIFYFLNKHGRDYQPIFLSSDGVADSAGNFDYQFQHIYFLKDGIFSKSQKHISTLKVNHNGEAIEMLSDSTIEVYTKRKRKVKQA